MPRHQRDPPWRLLFIGIVCALLLRCGAEPDLRGPGCPAEMSLVLWYQGARVEQRRKGLNAFARSNVRRDLLRFTVPEHPAGEAHTVTITQTDIQEASGGSVESNDIALLLTMQTPSRVDTEYAIPTDWPDGTTTAIWAPRGGHTVSLCISGGVPRE